MSATHPRPRVTTTTLLLLLSLVAALLVGITPTALAAAPPTGFVDRVVATDISVPRSMAMAPDGRVFVLQGDGRIRAIVDDQLQAGFVVQIPVTRGSDRGLHSMAFHNDFANNGHVFITYTTTEGGNDHNVVSRFTMTGNTIDLASEQRVFRFPRIEANLHYGMAVEHGADGKVYVSVGEHVDPSNGQDTSNVLGTVVRLNEDGSIPTDNPFYGQFSGDSRAIYAYGFRNPWQTAENPRTGAIMVADVGASSWEEANLLAPGANYGWAASEGMSSNPAHTDPLMTYPHFGIQPGAAYEGCAITGGAWYEGSARTFPTGYHGDYFFGDYCAGFIRVMNADGSDDRPFATGFTELVDMAVSPTNGALYYLDRAFNGDDVGNRGGVGKIEWAGGGGGGGLQIDLQPQDVNAAIGERVSFTTSASSAGGNIQYQWRRNGEAMPGETSATLVIESVAQSDVGDVFSARVTDGEDTIWTRGAQLTASSNRVPQPTILNPPVGTTFFAGETIAFSGEANDPDDGALPPASLDWEIRLNHDDHDHGFEIVTGTGSGEFTIPTVNETDDNIWYTIYLTATDSDGTSSTVTRRIDPLKAEVTLTTEPAGQTVLLDQAGVQTPYTFTVVRGVERQLQAPATVNVGGVNYSFDAWADAPAAGNRRVIAPFEDKTFTATYARDGGGGGGGGDTERPSIPTNMRVTGTTADSVSLAWDASTDDEGVAGYDVFRSDAQGDIPDTPVGRATGTSFTDTGLEPDTVYWYHLKAVDTSGNLSYRNGQKSARTLADDVVDTTRPIQPSNTRVTATTATSVTLAWDAGTDDVGVAGYQVFRSDVRGVYPDTPIGETQTTSFRDDGLSPATTYWYHFRTVDTAGNVSWRTGQRQATTEPAGPNGDGVVLVVGDDALTANEASLRGRLQNRGYTVTVVRDDRATVAGVEAADAVVVSGDVQTRDLRGRLKDAAVPLVNLKTYLHDDLGLTGRSSGTDFGILPNQAELRVQGAAPAFFGTGTVRVVAPGDTRMGFGVPGGDGQTWALLEDTPAAFGYAGGDTLADGSTAAACRIGHPVPNRLSRFSDDGWELLVSVIAYAVTDCSGDGAGIGPAGGIGVQGDADGLAGAAAPAAGIARPLVAGLAGWG